jgi:acyl-CoA thioester hydrolase
VTTPFRFPVRVYYEDTDFSGAVYHAAYLKFMERCRTEMLRARGIDQGRVLAGNDGPVFGFVVRAMAIEFLKPARMDDLLQIEAVSRKIGAASLDLHQRVLRGDEVLVTADVRIGCVVNGRAGRIPADVRAKLMA